MEEQKKEKALLIGTYSRNVSRGDCEEHLDELAALAYTREMDVASKVSCPLNKIERSTYLGKGKVHEIAAMIPIQGASVVIFDDDIFPSQQRNLEKALGVPVMDRTGIILDVFAMHARTKEAKLQVELAKLKYQLPRLKNLWTHLSRQRGGSLYLKGEGEKQIEIDKQLLKKKVANLQKELEEVKQNRETQRHARQRSGIPTFAIVGYTNSGKSTLLNALTDAEVLVEDKLFATLDTTTRKFTLPNNQEILLIDTVGFIRKIPHLLVASFKSTLEESVKADILIHLVDISHPMAEEQAESSTDVLEELGAENKTVITAFNKIDKCKDLTMIDKLRVKYLKTVVISALNKEGFDKLIEKITEELAKMRKDVNLRVPQSKYHLVSEIMRTGNVLYKEYDGNDVVLRAEVPLEHLWQVQKYIED